MEQSNPTHTGPRRSKRIRAQAICHGTAAASIKRPLAHKLCSKCRSTIRNSKVLSRRLPRGPVESLKEVYQDYGTIKELKRASRAGCHLCSLLYNDGTQYTESSKLIDKTLYSLEIVDFIMGVYPSPREVWLKLTRAGGLLNNLYLYPTTQAEIELQHYPSLKFSSTSSDASFHLASSWLKFCLKYHNKCSAHLKQPGFLPSRLLYISAEKSGLHVKLCERNILPSKTQYFTLSYYWGKKEHILLTSQTYNLYNNNIPVGDLPKSVLDAIIITLRLGYNHLWVDRLCIFQDSPEAWSSEAEVMGKIYQNGICNISAAVSDHCDGGCFNTRNPLSNLPCTLPIIEAHSGLQWAATSSSGGVGYSPINSRGWVVQESALAPRTLYYNSNIIHWKCVTAECSEISPSFTSSLPSFNMKCSLNILLDTSPDTLYQAWKLNWWSILQVYTRCSLTHADDKWNAISGLSRLVEAHSQKSLIAGHWAEYITEDITWRVDPGYYIENDNGVREPWKLPSKVSPTWSWISIHSPVMSFLDGPTWATIQSVCETTICTGPKILPNSLSLGLADSTLLHIKGPVISLVWTIEQAHSIEAYHDYGKFFVYRVHNMGQNLDDKRYGPRWFPDFAPEETAELWMLQTCASRRGDGAYGVAGLVIAKTEAVSSEQFYRRVGAFSFTLQADEHVENGVLKIGETKSVKLI